MTPDVLGKLEDAFMNAFTDEMACLYAGIHKDTLYEYCKKNPAFSERKEVLKITPDMAAQKTLIKDLENIGGARWWAERRMGHFIPKSKVELSGRVQTQDVTQDAAQQKIKEEYEEKLKNNIVESHRK